MLPFMKLIAGKVVGKDAKDVPKILAEVKKELDDAKAEARTKAPAVKAPAKKTSSKKSKD